MIHHHHNFWLVCLSILIAIFSSYIALDLSNSLTQTKGRLRWIWLAGGSLAMGVGIWSMHFVGMLAFSLPSISISYDVPLLILSILVAIGASTLTLILVSRSTMTTSNLLLGSLFMGAAIAGMHYIGIASMRMAAEIHWNSLFVFLSIFIAVLASFGALLLAFKLKSNNSKTGYLYRVAGGIVMGLAISGMHYTAMNAMSFTVSEKVPIEADNLLATNGLATSVILATVVILLISLIGSLVDRELSRRINVNNSLRDAIRTRDVFLSVASHELKTPLTSVKLQIQLIQRTLDKILTNSKEKEKISSMLEKSNTSIDRVTRLVDDMLDISRISSGKLNLQVEKFSLPELVSDIVERLEPLLAEAKCQVNMKRMDDIIGEWDKFRLEQVITNLLTNAARYGSGRPIEIQVVKELNQAKICIKDFGRGISLSDQERIFQRFERGSLNNEVKGLGLGLYIVKEILKMHHGQIEVHSELGIGSEFIVSLPIVASIQVLPDQAWKPNQSILH